MRQSCRPAVVPMACCSPKACALILRSLPSPSVPLWSAQVMTKPSSGRAAIAEVNWNDDACVLTRNSVPTLAPPASKTCALMSESLKSPLLHETTKPPSTSAVIGWMPWLPAICVLTRNSAPTLPPAAS